MRSDSKKLDSWGGLLFALLTLLFVTLMTREDFFEWAFRRHQNLWSWYLRPLFLIPFCIAAYRRSFTGVFLSVFAMLTSMFWFPQPAQVSSQVQEFLAFERNYLTSDWDAMKITLAATVPISLSLLALAFWIRSLWMGIAVIVLMAVGKVLWSVAEAGESGWAIIVPAVLGLLVCVGLFTIGFMLQKRKSSSEHS